MPQSLVRLSAGRQSLSDEAQAMCFLAGANSIFYGERLLTTENPQADVDRLLFDRLGLHAMESDQQAKVAGDENSSSDPTASSARNGSLVL